MMCIHENCELPARYGKVDNSTGMFEKKHCKSHKKDGEKGHPPKWNKRYPDFLTILRLIFYTLEITEEEWIEGTNKEGCYFKPKMKCPEGHEVTGTSIDSFVRGTRCSTCSGQIPWSKRYGEFKKLCKDNGYELLITEEEWIEGTKKKGCYFKPKMKCPNGHEVIGTCISNFITGNRCFICSGNTPWNERYEEIKEISTNDGYELLITKEQWIEGTKKDGASFKPKMKCSEGHEVTGTSIDSFVNHGRRCIKCSGHYPWSKRYGEFKKLCNDNGYDLLITKEQWLEGTTEYGNNFKPKMKCPEGHEVTGTDINNFSGKKNRRCSTCSGNTPWSKRYEEFKKLCNDNGYELLMTEEEWIEGTKKDANKFKPKMKCPNGHEVIGTCISNFITGNRCSDCSQSRSENMMVEIVKNLYPNNEWKKVRPDFLKYNKGANLELDLYCSELKLAFEYDGRQHREYVPHFHKTEEEFEELQKRDIWKDARCKEQGIRLIRIPDIDGEICIDCYNPENMEKYIKEHC